MGPARLIVHVAVACAVLLAAADTALGLEKKVIRINHAGAADPAASEHQLYATLFADYINAKSQTLEVRIFPNSGLGQSRQVIEGIAMQLGSSASIHIGGMAEFASFCETKCGVVGLPFVFRNFDHVARVMDGPVGAVLATELEKSGLKVISYLNSWGYRNVATANKRIDAVADLKGLTIRTIPTPVFVGAINAMGAAARPMDFGEIGTAMQAGRLDGFEHTAATVLSFKFYGIAKYYALTQHLIDPTVVVFSAAEWRGLDADEQALVMEAANNATMVARAMAPVREAESLAKLQKLGMIITHPDMMQARAKSVDLQWEMAAKLRAEDLLQQINAQANN